MLTKFFETNLFARFKNYITYFILCGCCGGFLWITGGQVLNYLSNATAVSTSWVNAKSPFPSVVFCSARGFIDEAKTAYVDKDTYNKIAIPVNVELIGKGFYPRWYVRTTRV
jgi:hypothetical protein